MANRFFNPITQYFADDGSVLAGGKLYFYETGSATPADTYTTSALTPGSENTNPITLDSFGRHGSIFLDPSITYRAILKTSAGVTIWTADPVVDPAANVAAVIAVYPGNPNGNVSGVEGTPGGIGSSMVYDSSNDIIYVCTQTGDSATAVWTATTGGAADVGAANVFTVLPQTVRSTDAGASVGPFFVADWDSATPASNDIATIMQGIGEDSAGNDQVYARLRFRILDPTSGSEDGDFLLGVVTGGTVADVIVIDGSALYPWTSGAMDLGRAAERFGAAHLTTVELGHATDTTLGRAAAGIMSVEGVPIINADHCAFKCSKNGDQALSTTGALTTITGWTEVYDQGSKFASNAWVPIAGRVALDALLTLTDDAACNVILFIMKNLTTVVAAIELTTGTGGEAGYQSVLLHAEDDANGTDSYTLRYYTSSAGYTVKQDDSISGVPYLVSWFTGHMIGG